jgi:hypothetical protein
MSESLDRHWLPLIPCREPRLVIPCHTRQRCLAEEDAQRWLFRVNDGEDSAPCGTRVAEIAVVPRPAERFTDTVVRQLFLAVHGPNCEPVGAIGAGFNEGDPDAERSDLLGEGLVSGVAGASVAATAAAVPAFQRQ